MSKKKHPSHEAKVRDARVGRDPAFHSEWEGDKKFRQTPGASWAPGKLPSNALSLYICKPGGSNTKARLIECAIALGYVSTKLFQKMDHSPLELEKKNLEIHQKNTTQSSKKNTPPKTNMEPENGPLEKEIPIGNHHFQVPC